MRLLLAALLSACAFGAQAAVTATAPVVTNAWISEAPPVAKNNAAYATVRNGSGADVLLGVDTPVAATAELHEMNMSGGLMRMRELEQVDLAPGQEVRFAPGGYHIMLVGMKRPLAVGEKVPLTFRFRHAGRITVEAEVRPLDVDGRPAH
jgi:copper(I)-binding protein